MGVHRVIVDLFAPSEAKAIELAKSMRMVAVDVGVNVMKTKVIVHPDQDDEKHILVHRQ